MGYSFERWKITNAFQNILDESGPKNKQNKGSEFYKRSIRFWLKDYYTEMYSTHNKEKSVAAEIFIRTLKNKIYKYMSSVSKMSISTN